MEPLMFLPMLFVALFWVAVVAGGGYLLLRAIRAYERRGAQTAAVDALGERLRLVEDAVARIEGEVQEMGESQRFTARLLAERTPPTGLASPDEP